MQEVKAGIKDKAARAGRAALALALAVSMCVPAAVLYSPPAYADDAVPEGTALAGEDYIAANVNEDVIDARAGFTETGFTIHVKQTYVDDACSEVKSIDEFYEEWGAPYLVGCVEDDAVPVYVAADGSDNDTLVAFVDPSKSSSLGKTVCSYLTYTDAEQTKPLLGKCDYDQKSGVLYIPRSLFVDDDAGKVKEYSLTMQNLVAVDAGLKRGEMNLNGLTTDITLSIDNNRRGVTAPSKTSIETVDAFDVTTTFQIATADTAAEVDPEALEVHVNGLEEEFELVWEQTDDQKATAAYDDETGELTLALAPSALTRADVAIQPKGIVDAVLGTQKAYAASGKLSADDLDEFPWAKDLNLKSGEKYDAIDEGGLYKFSSAIRYDETLNSDQVSARANTKPYVYVSAQYAGDKSDPGTYQMCNALKQGSNSYTWKNLQKDFSSGVGKGSNTHADWLFFINLPTGNGRKYTSGSGTDKKFEGDTINFDNWYDTNEPASKESTSHNYHWIIAACAHDSEYASSSDQTSTLYMRVLKSNADYMILGFASEGHGRQEAYGIIKVPAVDSPGAFKIKKVSSDESMTKNNPCYGKLSSARFGVWPKGDETKDTVSGTRVKVATKKGADPTVKNVKPGKKYYLDPGTYYVRELKNYTPENYQWSKDVWKLVIKANSTAVKTHTFKNKPNTDPGNLTLYKADQEAGETTGWKDAPTSYHQHSKDLNGAEFTLKYWKALSSAGPTGNPTKTWVFKTKNYGRIVFNNKAYLSSGSFYLDSEGKPAYPYGVYTIQETKAPAGYSLDSRIYTATVDATHSFNNLKFSQGKAVSNVIKRNDLKITKKDGETSGPMKSVAFVVSLLDDSGKPVAGQQHLMATNADGVVSTAAADVPHTANTNAGDAAVKLVNKEGKEYSLAEAAARTDGNGVGQDGVSVTIDEDALNEALSTPYTYTDAEGNQQTDEGFGTWFGLADDGTEIDAADDKGALVAGRYAIYEFDTSATGGYQLLDTKYVTITDDADDAAAAAIDLANWHPSVTTSLADSDDGDKVVVNDPETDVVDSVAATNLYEGRSYTLKAKLYDKAAYIAAGSEAAEPVAAEAPMADAVEVNGMVSFAGKTEDYISVLHENRNVDDWESRVGAEDKSRTVYAYHVFVAARELEEAVDARRAEMREEREHRPFQPQRERTDEEKAALEARRARMRERNAPLRKALGIPESMSFKEYAKLNDIPKSVSVGEWARARGLYPPRDGGNVR